MVCLGGPINGPGGPGVETTTDNTATQLIEMDVSTLTQPESVALSQDESSVNGKPTLERRRTLDEITIDMIRFVSGRQRISSSEINRVFSSAFGSFPYDIKSISDRIFPILDDLGTLYGTHQRRVLSYILAWIEVSGKYSNVKLRNFLFEELAAQTLTISQLMEIEASNEQVARQVFEIFNNLSLELELKTTRELLLQASAMSDTDGNLKNSASTERGASNIDPSRNNDPDKDPAKPMDVKDVLNEYFAREMVYPQEKLVNSSQRKLTWRDIGSVIAIHLTRPPKFSTIGCIKDRLLTGSIDNGDIIQFLSLTPNEQAYSFYEILEANPEKGHKFIGQLISLVSKDLHLLEIFTYLDKLDVVEILENTKPSLVYMQFSKWLDDYPNLINEEALQIFNMIFKHGSKYPFLYSLIEKVPSTDVRKMHYKMRITDQNFDADLAETVRGGLKQTMDTKLEL